MLNSLRVETKKLGKPQWRDLLSYLVELHERSLHAPLLNVPYPWEAISFTGGGEMAFGHWDTVHVALDTLSYEPQHALHLVLNNLSLQQPDGLIPGPVWLENGRWRWNSKTTFPPLWPMVVQDYFDRTKQFDILESCYQVLVKQIEWFEMSRQAGKSGFYYLDCLDRFWESGVEEGVRFDAEGAAEAELEDMACIDATSHVAGLYGFAASWAKALNIDGTHWEKRCHEVQRYIQEEMFDRESGWFYDRWVMAAPAHRVLSFEGIWPLVVGAATAEQARRVVTESLLDSSRFFAAHPITTVGIHEPSFEYYGWRGPTRNSMTYWAARGALRYGHAKAACDLIERALDATAQQFERTGKLWEYYHPHGGDPRTIMPSSHPNKGPGVDCLGHNPLIAMTILWEQARGKGMRDEGERMKNKGEGV